MYNNYFLDKTVLITGGGSGIGRELCLQLAPLGSIIICTDINADKASETISLITPQTGKATAQKLDVAQPADFEKLIAEIIATHGRLDFIFNNAGIAVSGEMRDIPLNDWKKIIDINFLGMLYGSQLAYQQMAKQGSGHIVNTASAAGLVDYLVILAPYSVTKHAVVNYTKILRAEAKALNVRATAICPGFIKTDIANNAVAPNAKGSWNDNAVKEVNKGLPVSQAVKIILKGVAANKELVIFPFNLNLLLMFTRVFKSFYRGIVQQQMKQYRKTFRMN